MTSATPGSIWLDDRGRYLRVDALTDDHAQCTVIAKTVGQRITRGGTTTGLRVDRLTAMTPVERAPELSPPDHAWIGIDRTNQILYLDGHPVLYHVGSSGPRIKHLDGGGLAVTVTLYATSVRDVHPDPKQPR
ncbi:hypothetical protein [Nocardia farcinica]